MNTTEARAVIELAYGDYAAERERFRIIVHTAILAYLAAGANQRDEREKMQTAVKAAIVMAVLLGFTASSGESEPPADVLAWGVIRAAEQLASVDSLFDTLSNAKKDPEFTRQDAIDLADVKAENYAIGLDSVYNESKVRGAGSMMLTFGGTDGHAPEFPCPECKRLKGQRHSAKWWVSHGLVPYPGNTNFTCGTWQCQHYLFDDQGRVMTLPTVIQAAK